MNSHATHPRIRPSFGRIATPEMPNLLRVQRESYERFLQVATPPEKRKPEGLEAVFRSVFPIHDFSDSIRLEYLSYRLDEPTHSLEECRVRDANYSVPLRVSLRLIVWEKNGREKGSESRQVKDIKEQDIYLGDIPLMTESGSFLISGSERVIVSQMHKSPGVFFAHDKGRKQASGKLLYSARIIPQRGSWLDMEFDTKDVLYARIDSRRKFPATLLLRAMGYSEADLLERFYPLERVELQEALGQPREERRYYREMESELLLSRRAMVDVVDPASGNVLVHAGRRFTRPALRRLKAAGIKRIPMQEDELLGRVIARAVRDAQGNEIASVNRVLDEELLDQLLEAGQETLELILPAEGGGVDSLRETLAVDGGLSTEEALIELHKRLKPGDPVTLDSARNLLGNLFFQPQRYSLSRVGRLKLNRKLNRNEPSDLTVLTRDDLMDTVGYLLRLKERGEGNIDDIDHLGNRRVRAVGELLENQFRVGLVRMERAVRERMSLQDAESMMLHDLVNNKPVNAAINEFFNSSQLSQFMDQTNPLAEITHKRRLSALGPGGLTREWAGFDVRDVHPSHYGRICPIETPEGPNIGLIASLATFSSVNSLGFIETPYRKVKDGRVTSEIDLLSAIEEDRYKIAQANAPLNAQGDFVNPLVSVRHRGEFELLGREEIDYMDVAPHQLVSAASALIPFLEHDDANRALMGSNMQRQAVPLIRPAAPLVGTGMERKVAADSGACVVARHSGVVDRVDAERIVLRVEETAETPQQSNGGNAIALLSGGNSVGLSANGAPEANVDIYHLAKFQRSNQNICINQRPIVSPGQRVKQGDVIADGSSCEEGELALGQNLIVAFMPWNGYNFEDSVLISERVVRDEMFTSIHIEEEVIVTRETKLGREELTRDVPNVSEEALKNLDESGVVRVGTYVRPNDILVGKVTPKGEVQLNPEEKLLRAIFGEKAADVRDTSLRVRQGIEGVVIDVVAFSSAGVEEDLRTKEISKATEEGLNQDHADEVRVVRSSALRLLEALLDGRKLVHPIAHPQEERELYPTGSKIDAAMLHSLPMEAWRDLHVSNAKLMKRVQQIVENTLRQIESLEHAHLRRCTLARKEDSLAPGILRMFKVYIAVKRRLSVGDKMAGRHGNKGVISRIEAVENMPYLADGRTVDVVLNPLGVPSRMNVGQILETHLGWGAAEAGRQLDDMLQQQNPLPELRKHVQEVLQDPTLCKHMEDLNDDDFIECIQQFRKGFRFASPVFDGAREEDIEALLKAARLDISGQTILYDGISGDAFEQPVTVGCIYMMKLHHLVDDKIHARSIGPYSLVTQQPLGGKAHFGGQRFGEMEVWALEAYGAAYTLQEMLTAKSDDIMGRNRIYENIVKGRYSLETGVPESFRVLTNELKSLCLDVQLLN